MALFASLRNRIKSASLSGAVFLFPLILLVGYGDPIWIAFDAVLGRPFGLFGSTYALIAMLIAIGFVYRLAVDVSLRSVIVGGLSFMTVYFAVLYIFLEFDLTAGALTAGYAQSGYFAVGFYVLGAIIGGRMREYVTDAPKYHPFSTPTTDKESTDSDS